MSFAMDAGPILAKIGKLLERHGLEAIMIGNAAAALQGAPVTTVDIDFLIRKSAANERKLKAIARELDATVLRPFYPVSGLYRMVRDDDLLQLDFMTAIDGIRSFEGLRQRSRAVRVGGSAFRVAALADIIKSKRAAGRPRDLAALEVLERTLDESADEPQGDTGSSEERE